MRRFRRIVLLLLVLAAAAALLRFERAPRVEAGSVLKLDLEGPYVEAADTGLLPRLMGTHRTPLVSLLSELRKAERDDRIAGVALRIRKLGVGWGKAQEIRDAITRLREAGRRPVAYLEVEGYGANLEYYVATAAEQVYISPAARLPFVGLAAEYLFLGGLWQKLGVEVEVERVGEYKSAAEFLAGEAMSDANREMSNALLDSVETQFVTGIAERRGLAPSDVRAAIDAAPVAPAELKRFALVDGIAFYDEMIEELGSSRPQIEARDYARVDPASVGFDPVASFALVYGSGSVVTGEGSSSPRGEPVLASETVARALHDAAEDPEIKAIILRIDSPGGSALASDVVWRATQEARERKPVIASFSDLAASGGYYVACGTDAIVAQPGTLTGSIGVFVLRPVLAGLFGKLGIGFEGLTRGAHADLLLATRSLSPQSRARMEAEVRAIYELFVARVAQGRALDAERVDAVGRGRVWTGAQAAERGLVDALGGLRAAVEKAKEKAAIDPKADVALVPFPAPKPITVQLREALEGAARAAVPDLPVPAALQRLAAALDAAPPGAPVLLPPFTVEIR